MSTHSIAGRAGRLLAFVLAASAFGSSAAAQDCRHVLLPNVMAPPPIQGEWVEVPLAPGMAARDSASGIQWCANIGFVTRLSPDNATLPGDGLYIYVLRTWPNYDLVLRPSDRPADYGLFAGGDSARFAFTGNPPSPTEQPHMFVRHTQLNGRGGTVYAAGQLEIKAGRIIWVSNESGHYMPPNDGPSLDYVYEVLAAWGIAHSADRQEERTLRQHWYERWTRVPDPSDDPYGTPYVIAARSSGPIVEQVGQGGPSLVGVDASQHLTFRDSLPGGWTAVPRDDDFPIGVWGLTVLNDGSLLALGDSGRLYLHRTADGPWQAVSAGSVRMIAIAAGLNDRIYGVGEDHFLYRREGFADDWRNVNQGQALVSIAVSREGNVFGIGTDGRLYGLRGSRQWQLIADRIPELEPVNGAAGITSIAIICDDRIADPEKKERLVGVGSGGRAIWIRQAPSLSGTRPSSWSCRQTSPGNRAALRRGGEGP